MSLSWLFFIPIFNSPNYFIGSAFLFIGLIFSALAFYKEKVEINKRYILFVILLISPLAIIPFPYKIGPLFLIIPLIFYYLFNHFYDNKGGCIFKAFIFSGIILTLQSAFLPIYTIIVSHNHRIDLLSYPSSALANLFGLQTTINSGLLYVQSNSETFAFTTTFEKLGFFPWFNILIGFIIFFVFIFKIKKFWKYLLGFLFISFL